MALDWLKVEKVTPDKPEIIILARKLQISQGEAFLNWFRVYSWADGITSDGRVPFLSLEDGDRLSRSCPGTCAALASKEIGWLATKTVRGVDGIEFKNWDRHNGESAKKRANAAEKKRKQRKKCPPEIGTDVPEKQGPEKRREDKRINKKGERPQNRDDFDQQVEAVLEAKRATRIASANGTEGTG